MIKLSSVIIGEQTLLIQCASFWVQQGHLIHCVVADNPAIVDWCEENNIECIAWRKDLDKHFAGQAFDYLLSITNLRILPDPLIELPTKIAINFHDGPLPKYAGLNVPAWALLNGEQSHGVTFHEMTTEVDKGDILKQKLFPVVGDESAFTLNAKCYQLAEEAFEDLVADITGNGLQRQTQDFSERSYFGLSQRPEAACFIDFQKTVVEIERLIRALDYGRYYSPLGYAKLNIGEGYVVVREATLEEEEVKPAGTIVAIDETGLSVSCADHVIKLSKIYSTTGERLCPKELSSSLDWQVGTQLPVMAIDMQAAITEFNRKIAGKEGAWIKQLQYLEPIELPYDNNQGKARAVSYSNELFLVPETLRSVTTEEVCAGDRLLAIAALYFARVGGKADYDLSFQHQTLYDNTQACATVFARTVPLRVSVSSQDNIESYVNGFNDRLSLVTKRGTYTTDLYLREPDLHNALRCERFPIACVRVTNLDQVKWVSTNQQHGLILVIPDNGAQLQWLYDGERLDSTSIKKMQAQFEILLTDSVENKTKPVTHLEILCDTDRAVIFNDWNNTQADYDNNTCMHQFFEAQVLQSPNEVALVFEGQQLSYAELNSRANSLARYLLEKGAGEGKLVGVLVDRSLEMIVSLLAVLKAGSAYVPLDPVYPKNRLAYMIEDSQAVLVITNDKYENFLPGMNVPMVKLEEQSITINGFDSTDLHSSVSAADLAYVIYTSGSTGKPKGVMVEHRNVSNFFAGMDQRIDKTPGVWLAVTSISFDISVLEIFWTLARGFKVIIYADEKRQKTSQQKARSKYPQKNIDFSLFFWNVATEDTIQNQDKYRLLFEASKFGDSHDFKALWTPERHFGTFGGLFPNPSVSSAALAAITEKIHIRSGSCVVPLHSPIRIAEEWAMVDNISNGRAGLGVAAGWAPPDFAIKPENYSRAKDIMFESVETVRKLWRGEKIPFEGPEGEVMVHTMPRPIQAEFPIWITIAGSEDSFRRAGEIGANVLTHLLGQTIEEVAEKIKIYRESWHSNGHPGEGIVTLMLHTLVGHDVDEVEAIASGPMKSYFASAASLVKDAAWNFPTFKKISAETGKTLDDFFTNINEQDLGDLLEFAFQRYFQTSGLFGTPETCVEMVDRCKEIDVDEIGCLIDYGIDVEIVLKHLPYLNEVRRLGIKQSAAETSVDTEDYSILNLLKTHNVSHLQCTPSMAMMLVADAEMHEPLAKLKQVMVGGEAFPAQLAQDLHGIVGGKVTNMYGPTETTVWSSTFDIDRAPGSVSIGKPIANTQIYIVDENLQQLPVGVIGELVIAGDSVARGYLNQEDLTKERFILEHFSDTADMRMYRTGDLAKHLEDGKLACLGRVDHQVKIRGYRVELGEIEALLQSHEQIRDAAVLLREDDPGNQRLVAYVRFKVGQKVVDADLKTFLFASLPEFMVPVVFMELKVLPLTLNGKVDRKVLPAPQKARSTGSDNFVLPANEWETLLADIWKAALGVDSVGTKDNFFDIGGHSLLVIQVLTKLRENEKVTKAVQMTDLFRYTTIEGLAQFITSDEEDSQALDAGQARASARKASMGRRRKSRRK